MRKLSSCSLFFALLGVGFSTAAQAAPKVIFTVPKGVKGGSTSLSTQILCASAPRNVSAGSAVTLYLSDEGRRTVEKFTKPLVGKAMEYSICGGKKQRVRLSEPMASNILTLSLTADARIDCLNVKPSCD